MSHKYLVSAALVVSAALFYLSHRPKVSAVPEITRTRIAAQELVRTLELLEEAADSNRSSGLYAQGRFAALSERLQEQAQALQELSLVQRRAEKIVSLPEIQTRIE